MAKFSSQYGGHVTPSLAKMFEKMAAGHPPVRFRRTLPWQKLLDDDLPSETARFFIEARRRIKVLMEKYPESISTIAPLFTWPGFKAQPGAQSWTDCRPVIKDAIEKHLAKFPHADFGHYDTGPSKRMFEVIDRFLRLLYFRQPKVPQAVSVRRETSSGPPFVSKTPTAKLYPFWAVANDRRLIDVIEAGTNESLLQLMDADLPPVFGRGTRARFLKNVGTLERPVADQKPVAIAKRSDNGTVEMEWVMPETNLLKLGWEKYSKEFGWKGVDPESFFAEGERAFMPLGGSIALGHLWASQQAKRVKKNPAVNFKHFVRILRRGGIWALGDISKSESTTARWHIELRRSYAEEAFGRLGRNLYMINSTSPPVVMTDKGPMYGFDPAETYDRFPDYSRVSSGSLDTPTSSEDKVAANDAFVADKQGYWDAHPWSAAEEMERVLDGEGILLLLIGGDNGGVGVEIYGTSRHLYDTKEQYDRAWMAAYRTVMRIHEDAMYPFGPTERYLGMGLMKGEMRINALGIEEAICYDTARDAATIYAKKAQAEFSIQEDQVYAAHGFKDSEKAVRMTPGGPEVLDALDEAGVASHGSKFTVAWDTLYGQEPDPNDDKKSEEIAAYYHKYAREDMPWDTEQAHFTSASPGILSPLALAMGIPLVERDPRVRYGDELFDIAEMHRTGKWK